MISIDKCDVVVSIEPEDIPVRGNLIDSGDKERDTKDEDEVIECLNNGDHWAWGYVKVKVSLKEVPELTHTETLGCCSYGNEKEFLADNYYSGMILTCLEELNAKAKKISELFL